MRTYIRLKIFSENSQKPFKISVSIEIFLCLSSVILIFVTDDAVLTVKGSLFHSSTINWLTKASVCIHLYFRTQIDKSEQNEEVWTRLYYTLELANCVTAKNILRYLTIVKSVSRLCIVSKLWFTVNAQHIYVL